MPFPGGCDPVTIAENQQAAKQKFGAAEIYAEVYVKIIGQTWDGKDGTIEFEAHMLGAATHTMGTHKAKWGDDAVMWPSCPSSLPSTATKDDPGPPPAVGAEGILYLSKAFIDKNNIYAVTMPKWPKAD
jgi:hypothetical protein